MFPQSWIVDCLRMYNISDDVIKFSRKVMKNWKVEMTEGRKPLAEDKI